MKIHIIKLTFKINNAFAIEVTIHYKLIEIIEAPKISIETVTISRSIYAAIKLTVPPLSTLKCT